MYVCLIFLLTSTIKYYSPWERNNNGLAFGTLSWITKEESVKRHFLLSGWMTHCSGWRRASVLVVIFMGTLFFSGKVFYLFLCHWCKPIKFGGWWGSYTFMKNNWSQAIKSGMMTMAWISKWCAISFEVLTNLIVINIKDRFMLTTSSCNGSKLVKALSENNKMTSEDKNIKADDRKNYCVFLSNIERKTLPGSFQKWVTCFA